MKFGLNFRKKIIENEITLIRILSEAKVIDSVKMEDSRVDVAAMNRDENTIGSNIDYLDTGNWTRTENVDLSTTNEDAHDESENGSCEDEDVPMNAEEVNDQRGGSSLNTTKAATLVPKFICPVLHKITTHDCGVCGAAFVTRWGYLRHARKAHKRDKVHDI